MTPPSAAEVLAAARAAKGFMPDNEGLALAHVAGLVGVLDQPANQAIVEVGAYCGRSALYMAHGILAANGDGQPPTVLFSLDHHHGSEENQAGWAHHDASLVDAGTGRMDTLAIWRRNIDTAGVAHLVVGLVGDSPTIAARWAAPAGMVFIDGGHGAAPAWADYRGWSPHVATGGWLAIHDVFPDPADGGRPPYELYCAALESGDFEEEPELGCGSLRVLQRLA